MTVSLQLALLLVMSLIAASTADADDKTVTVGPVTTPTRTPFTKPTKIPEVQPESCKGQQYLLIGCPGTKNQYFECKYGQQIATYTCPAPLLFNYRRQWCDWTDSDEMD